MLSHDQLFVTPLTVAHQAPLSMGLCRRESWNGLPFPSPGDHPDPGTELASPALAFKFFTTVPPRKPAYNTPGHFTLPITNWHLPSTSTRIKP